MLPKDVIKIAMEQGFGLTFDDVLLVPGHSGVVPRDICLKTNLTEEISLNTPFVSADMDTVTGPKFAESISRLGGFGFLYKTKEVKVQIEWVNTVKSALNTLIERPAKINLDSTKAQALEVLAIDKNRFSSLVVVDSDEKVVGLLTEDGMNFAVGDDDLVKNFMLKNPVITEQNLDADQAYNLMMKRKVRKLIQVDEDGRLKGLYTFDDVKSVVKKSDPFNRDRRGQLRVGANVGIRNKENSNEFDARVEGLLKERCDALLVGVAHGDSDNAVRSVKSIKNDFKSYNPVVVAGNVATYDGAKNLIEAGADAIKVGIGPGSICSTRIVTGAGMPQITAIYDVVMAAKEKGIYVIADGGIRCSGDVTKALGAGAHSVMIGGLFAGTEEAPGEEFIFEGQICKRYRGMGSASAMRDLGGERYGERKGDKLVPEGVEGRVPYKGNLVDVLYKLEGGLRAGMGLVGAESIKDLHEKAKFVRITNAGVLEGSPHDVDITGEV